MSTEQDKHLEGTAIRQIQRKFCNYYDSGNTKYHLDDNEPLLPFRSEAYDICNNLKQIIEEHESAISTIRKRNNMARRLKSTRREPYPVLPNRLSFISGVPNDCATFLLQQIGTLKGHESINYLEDLNDLWVKAEDGLWRLVRSLPTAYSSVGIDISRYPPKEEKLSSKYDLILMAVEQDMKLLPRLRRLFFHPIV